MKLFGRKDKGVIVEKQESIENNTEFNAVQKALEIIGNTIHGHYIYSYLALTPNCNFLLTCL